MNRDLSAQAAIMRANRGKLPRKPVGRPPDGPRGETQRFQDRLRFDQAAFWDFRVEPRSPIPSSFPAFANACRVWGIPVWKPNDR